MKRTFLIPLLSILLLSAANVLQAAPIHKAVRNNDIVGVEKALIESDGTAVEAVLGGGITPLHIAAALDHRAIAGLLLCQGAKVNQKNLTGFTPLHWAAGKDAVKTLDLLITFGADVNAKAENGITPLHYAASKNATNAVSKLLVAGADVNLQTESGLPRCTGP